MKLIKTFILIASLLLLTGCGRNFVRPTDVALVVGSSTRANVIQLVGKPSDEDESKLLNGEMVQTVMYSYHIEPPLNVGMIVATRTLTYTFFNNVMIGNEFNSTFTADSTEFDASKVASISKGKSTKADVIAAFGKPSGEILYPMMKDKTGRGIVYAYTVTRAVPFARPTTRYLLTFTLDVKNIVSKISYLIDGKEQIKS